MTVVMRTFLSILAVMVVARARPAEACVGIPCSDPWSVGFEDGGVVPANVPALLLTTPVTGFDTPNLAGITLSTATGIEVALSGSSQLGGRLLVLNLPVGLTPQERYVLRFPTLCREPDAGAVPFERAFTAGPSAPPPTSLGQLEVASTGHGQLAVHESISCGDFIDAAWAQLKLTPSPELVPFLPFTRWTLEVDGQLWTNEEVAAVLPSGLLGKLPSYPSQIPTGRRALQVHAACGATQGDVDRGTGLGGHTATLKAWVTGVEAPLTSSVSFTLACAGASQPPVPIEETPTSTPPQPMGCSTAPGALVMLAAMVLMRRRSMR